MKRNTIRLTESQLHRVIKESVKRILKESVGAPYPFSDAEMQITKLWVFERETWYEFEAVIDGWYSLRGSYDDDINYEELIVGHSGHGRQMDIDDEMANYLDATVTPRLTEIINTRIQNGDFDSESYDMDDDDMY